VTRRATAFCTACNRRSKLSVMPNMDMNYIKKSFVPGCLYKLEYLAVYGRASMAVFRQLSTHGQKFDPESLYEPI